MWQLHNYKNKNIKITSLKLNIHLKIDFCLVFVMMARSLMYLSCLMWYYSLDDSFIFFSFYKQSCTKIFQRNITIYIKREKTVICIICMCITKPDTQCIGSGLLVLLYMLRKSFSHLKAFKYLWSYKDSCNLKLSKCGFSQLICWNKQTYHYIAS